MTERRGYVRGAVAVAAVIAMGLVGTAVPADAAPAQCAGTSPIVCHFAVPPGRYTSEYGAGRMADLLVQGVRERGLSLTAYLR